MQLIPARTKRDVLGEEVEIPSAILLGDVAYPQLFSQGTPPSFRAYYLLSKASLPSPTLTSEHKSITVRPSLFQMTKGAFQESLKQVWDGLKKPQPLTLLRSNTQLECSDIEAHECFNGMTRVDRFCQKVFSVQPTGEDIGHLMRVEIHDPYAFNGACWSPMDKSVHCGDHDPLRFNSIASNPDIIAHEFGHAVTYYSSNLDYVRQSEAINESLSDIFAIMVKHRQAKVSADAPMASWSIAENFLSIEGRNFPLRSMSNPGSAFRAHPLLGDDDQIRHMRDYQEDYPLEKDHGGVHKYAGVGNYAFYLAATKLGGPSWKIAGKIWRCALVRSQRAPTFSDFATETLKAVEDISFKIPKEPIYQAVAQAWRDVGVTFRERGVGTMLLEGTPPLQDSSCC